jgi:kumamolisin
VDVGLALSNPSGLASYLATEYGPQIPTHRTFLTPIEVTARFGPSGATVAAAQQYFRSFGLSVATSPNELLLTVAGPSSGIARAFGTTFDQYRDPAGRTFVSHPTPATIPRSLASSGAYGLGNVSPITPDVTSVPTGVPPAGTAGGCSYGVSGLAPCQLAVAYNFSSLVGNGTNGSGERVGIVDAYDGGESQTRLSNDLDTFAEQYALPTTGITYAYPISTNANLNLSTTNPAWGLEEALDIEWARATAPGASITMTFSPDAGPGLIGAVDWLVATDAVNVISMSWGEPLTGVYNAFSQPCSSACNASTDGTFAILDPVFEAAAAEGISVFAATGDCGSADGTSGQAVNYPAADPWVTAVGGTLLVLDPNGSYLSETGWSGNASGSSAPGCTNQGGSGGGFAPLPRPAWQAGLPPKPEGRGIPDVALDADTAVSVFYGASYLGVIGTSVATPVWAGITAIADQKAGAALGLLNPSLYRIYGGSNYSRDFHDIVNAYNGYPAGPGWDAVTGLGTPIVASLLHDLTGPSPRLATEVSPFLFASPRFGRAPLTVSFALTVTGGTGAYPVEEVGFGDGNSSAASGIVTHTYVAPGVYSAGAFVLDSSDNGSTSPPVAIVVGGGSALNVSLTASDQTPAIETAVTFVVGASGGSGPVLYDLTFGDGTYLNNQSGPNVTHAYDAPGGYCAEAVARDARNPPDGGASSRVALSVGGAPVPDCENDSTPLTLTANPGHQVQDASVEFTDLFSVSGGASAPVGLSGSLQIRASDPYVEACQCAIFRTPGNYSVTAWYNDTVDQGVTATTTATVAPALDGVFSAGPLTGVAPLRVAFGATAEGGYLAHAEFTNWTFGDGFAAVGSTAAETYTQPGYYLAVGHLEDRGHGNASEAFLIDVLTPGAGTAYGISGTIAPAVDVSSGTDVQFSGDVRGPVGGPLVEESWDLGDGYSAFGPAPNETYFGPLPGIDANVLRGEVSVILPNTQVLANVSWGLPSFFALGSGGVVPRSQAIALSSDLTPTYGRSPLDTRGTAGAVGPGGASVEWTFGDGAVNFTASASHTYEQGTYTAVAEARDPVGDRAFELFAVSAFGPLEVTGGPSPSSGAPPLSVTFTALGLGGNGPPYTYRWSFEGANNTSGSSVVRSYASVGVYSATVNVTDGDGANVTRTWTVTVENPSPFSPVLLLTLAAAVGVGAGVAALFLNRAGGRARPPRPPIP